jgi:hypothetical protein
MRMTTMCARVRPVTALGALMVLLPAAGIVAQTPARPTSAFELGVGPAVAQGTGVGGHLTAAYVTAPSDFGLAIRLEGTLTAWHSLRGLEASSWSRLSHAGVGVVQTLSSGSLQPYLSAGVAAYTQQGSGLGFGLNGGAGLRFSVGSASLFTEARVHRPAARLHDNDVFRKTRLTQLTFGIRF